MEVKENELLDILQAFWLKYAQMYNYNPVEGEVPHRDITATVNDLANIQNRILARLVKKANPERFSE